MIIRQRKTTFMSCCSRANIFTITYHCNDIISYKIMIYFMFLIIYTRSQKFVALIFILFKYERG